MFASQSMQIELLVCGCMFCLIAALCIFLSNNFDRERRRWLFWMQLCTALLLGSDALTYLFFGYPGSVGYFMVRISNFLVFALSDVVMFLFHGYVCSYVLSGEQRAKSLRVKSVYWICIVALLFVVISQFIDLYYSFDADNCYYRSDGFIISVIFPVIGMLLDLTLLLQYHKNVSFKIFASMLTYILLPLGAAIIQSVSYGLALINMAIAVSMLIMYIVSTNEHNREMYQILKKKTEVEERLEIATTLNQCVKALSSDKDIDTAIKNLLEIINTYFRGDRTYLFEIDEDRKMISNTYEYVVAGVQPEIENLQNVPIDVIEAWMEDFKKDRPYLMSDLQQEEGRAAHGILQDEKVERLLAVPLKRKGQILGFLGIDNPQKHYDEATLLSSIQYFITNSLERKEQHERLHYLSYRDMLTGLYNRNKCISMVASCEGRTLQKTGIAYIDLNGLKQVNDKHGHEAGDDLICRAASAIRTVFAGYAFRVGGDEFAVVVTDIEEHKFFQKMADLDVQMKQNQVNVSVGALWRESVEDLNEMLKSADNLMYETKKEYYLKNHLSIKR